MFRLQLEPLETREVPASLALGGATETSDGADYSAIAFVGGWGSSMYQYAHNEPVAASVPTDQFALNFTKITIETRAPATTDDVVVDGRIITAQNYDSAPTADFHLVRVK